MHEPPLECQAATAVHGAQGRDGRPIVAPAARDEQHTIAAGAKARSGEPHGGIRTGNPVVEVPTVVPGTVYREAGEGVGCGHMETGRTWVVDGLDNGVVVVASYSFSIVHRPKVEISGSTPVIIVSSIPGIPEHPPRMPDGNTYVTATRGVIEIITVTLCNGIYTGQGFLTAELIERAIALSRVTRILRNGEDCLCTRCRRNLSFCLSDFHLDAAGSRIGRSTPSGVFPAKRLLCELVFMALRVRASDGAQHVLRGEPQMP